MLKDLALSVLFWAGFTGVVLVASCETRKEITNVVSADQFTEQCQHYHYGPDQTRNCMDKFLIRK